MRQTLALSSLALALLLAACDSGDPQERLPDALPGPAITGTSYSLHTVNVSHYGPQDGVVLGYPDRYFELEITFEAGTDPLAFGELFFKEAGAERYDGPQFYYSNTDLVRLAEAGIVGGDGSRLTVPLGFGPGSGPADPLEPLELDVYAADTVAAARITLVPDFLEPVELRSPRWVGLDELGVDWDGAVLADDQVEVVWLTADTTAEVRRAPLDTPATGTATLTLPDVPATAGTFYVETTARRSGVPARALSYIRSLPRRPPAGATTVGSYAGDDVVRALGIDGGFVLHYVRSGVASIAHLDAQTGVLGPAAGLSADVIALDAAADGQTAWALLDDLRVAKIDLVAGTAETFATAGAASRWLADAGDFIITSTGSSATVRRKATAEVVSNTPFPWGGSATFGFNPHQNRLYVGNSRYLGGFAFSSTGELTLTAQRDGGIAPVAVRFVHVVDTGNAWVDEEGRVFRSENGPDDLALLGRYLPRGPLLASSAESNRLVGLVQSEDPAVALRAFDLQDRTFLNVLPVLWDAGVPHGVTRVSDGFAALVSVEGRLLLIPFEDEDLALTPRTPSARAPLGR
jgi:hypothetical protein